MKSIHFTIFIILLIVTKSFAQDYSNNWKEIDSLYRFGLPKSALEKVDVIYEDSKKNNDQVNYIRSLIYKVKLSEGTEEDDFVNAIIKMQNELSIAAQPAKQIIHSLIADMYWQYYKRNTYKIMNRTEVVNYDLKDIRTWDIKKITEEIIKNYNSSLENENLLKSVNIERYNDILNEYAYDGKIPNGRKLRPTLFDFLVFKAISFYENSEAGLTKPADQFSLNDKSFFSEATDFIRIDINTSDIISFEYNALILYQKVIRFHINEPDLLIDADLGRLEFVHQNSGLQDKENLYLNSLINLAGKYENIPASAMINYNIASVYFLRSSNYNPDISANYKDDAIKAYDICKKTIDKFPDSEGANNCRVLLTQIESKSLSLKFEKATIPEKPFRGMVEYKNLKKLFFRVIETTEEELITLNEQLSGRGEDYRSLQHRLIEKVAEKVPVHSFSVVLPLDQDYQKHRTEIKFPALKKGIYIITASTDEKLTWNENAVAFGILWVTNISYIFKQKGIEGKNEFFLLNRDTGDPIPEAEIKIFTSKYDYEKSKWITKETGKTNSDKSGYFSIKSFKEDDYYYLNIRKDDDKYSTASINLGYSYSYYGESFLANPLENNYESKPSVNTFFFTDRSIYRPGQTVYFKGLIIETSADKRKILTDYNTTIVFYNVNGQKISDIPIKTNDYGTFNGSFIIPVSGLNGSMRIQNADNSGQIYIQVEEYKRPQFEVIIKETEGMYKLGQIVNVKGEAVSYSGVRLDNAKVKYTVTRNTIFPRWWYYYSFYKSPEAMISNGNTITDSKGEFQFNFTALPDPTIPVDKNTSYNYEISVDVTDINGETHSAKKYIEVGYNSLRLYTDIPEFTNKNGNNEFKLFTENYSGKKETVEGKIEIYKIKTPDRIINERLWEKPDKFLYSKEEFIESFPFEEYDNERDFLKWEKDFRVYEKKFNSGTDSTFRIENFSVWNQGFYKGEIKAKDNYGEEVITEFYFTAYSTGEKTLPYTMNEWIVPIKTLAEPGEKAEILLGTGIKNSRILFETESYGNKIKREWIKLSNEQKFISLPIKEEDRGNIGFSFIWTKHNRNYSYNGYINVPHINKMLDISFETFRDKTETGALEEWKIKIKGKKGEKTASEMVASMYDASLDAFLKHEWSFGLYDRSFYSYGWSGRSNFEAEQAFVYSEDWYKTGTLFYYQYDVINWFGAYYIQYPIYKKGYKTRNGNYDEEMMTDGKGIIRNEVVTLETEKKVSEKETVISDKKNEKDQYEKKKIEEEKFNFKNAELRTDLKETAFFYPELRTDEDGNLVLKFKMPESLTKWRMLGFAHTKDLKYGLIEKEIITQKEFSITPNLPRFFREDDKIIINTRISNLTESGINGEAILELVDAVTQIPVDNIMGNYQPIKYFTTEKQSNTNVNWEISIPYGIEAVICRIKAISGNFTDGEERIIPVLSNRMLVTETLPLPIRGNQTKKFTMEKLVNNSSNTSANYNLTLEFTSNPAWYAVQALPYLAEYPYECAEQLFSRIYANSIAYQIANSSPKIKEIFEQWEDENPEALLSNLEKNEELKSLMLEETPWVMESRNESERKRRISILFNTARMSSDLDRWTKKLKQMQVSNGAWPWFEGMPEDRYITQHITAGFGKLRKLGVYLNNEIVNNMLPAAVGYLDKEIKRDYDELKSLEAQGKIKLSDNNLSYIQIHYLYMRSYFSDIELTGGYKEAFEYFKKQSENYWNGRERYMQGMIALYLHRFGNKEIPERIIKSLREYAIINEETGMYWKDNESGYHWYEAPIETQSLLIEVFDEVAKDSKAVDDMKVWLLKQKQTQDWKTTKATVEACYALLMKGSNLLTSDVSEEISLGDVKLKPDSDKDIKTQAGTGYFKKSWIWGDVKPEMGNITVTKKNQGVSWGAIYWQYFEDIDKISKSETPLKLVKKLFLEKMTNTGKVLIPVDSNTKLFTGDIIKVRIELKTDRDMEYLHMKDMRASGFEPINVISQYKYQEGLGYYESTKDAATNFFFYYLPKGVYVFEYPLRVNLQGDFSAGITSIQCMYAPEFSSHSEGVRVKVD